MWFYAIEDRWRSKKCGALLLLYSKRVSGDGGGGGGDVSLFGDDGVARAASALVAFRDGERVTGPAPWSVSIARTSMYAEKAFFEHNLSPVLVSGSRGGSVARKEKGRLAFQRHARRSRCVRRSTTEGRRRGRWRRTRPPRTRPTHPTTAAATATTPRAPRWRSARASARPSRRTPRRSSRKPASASLLPVCAPNVCAKVLPFRADIRRVFERVAAFLCDALLPKGAGLAQFRPHGESRRGTPSSSEESVSLSLWNQHTHRPKRNPTRV